MSDVGRLVGWFDEGRLVRPSAETANFVDLVRALFALTGIDSFETTVESEKIARLIGPAEDYIFVLVDGMGTQLLARAPEGGFLRGHAAGELQAVFPSTTATALTTLATGLWPASNGIPGWWAYLEEYGLSATVLPFVERFSGRALGEWGVKAADVFTAASVWPGMRHEPMTLIASQLADSTFTTYSVGATRRVGSRGIRDGLAKAAARVKGARGPTFTYVYLPEVDSACHEKGTGSGEAARALAAVDGALGELAGELSGKARIVVTADHGLGDTTEATRFFIEEGSEILGYLVCPPTGEPTVPVFHVKKGQEGSFVDAFEGRLAGRFALLTPGEAEELELYGPEALSQVMRRRLGTFIAIADRPTTIQYQPQGGQATIHIGVHAGLSSAEMRVPLILA